MVMPRPRLPHLHPERTRHGELVWYVRVGHGPRTRIRAEYGTEAFKREYDAAIGGKPPAPKDKPSSKSLRWLIDRYKETTAWGDLAYGTRRQRDYIFVEINEKAGKQPFKAFTRNDIVAGRDRRKDTPNQARNMLDALRGVFRWALEAGHVTTDPTANVTNPKRIRNGGFPVWTEEDVAAYEKKWPLGTRQRVWLDVVLYSGLRRGDAVRFGKQHVSNGVAKIRTEKTNTEVALPILPVLQRTLDAGPTGDLTFIVNAYGRPFTKESIGERFRKAARAAGVNKSMHGLRKIAATRCAENGATVAELNAIFGWSGSQMALLYTQAADRKRLSVQAMSKMQNVPATSIPAPQEEVRESGEKAEQPQALRK